MRLRPLICARCGIEPVHPDRLVCTDCLVSSARRSEQAIAEELFLEVALQKAYLQAEHGWVGWNRRTPREAEAGSPPESSSASPVARNTELVAPPRLRATG